MCTKFFAPSRSACRGSTASHWLAGCWSSAFALYDLHVSPENGINRGLIAFAPFAEKRKHVGIEAQGNLLLRSRPEYRPCEEIRTEFGHLRKIYIRISKRINPLPVCAGSPFRIVCFHDGLPFSMRRCEWSPGRFRKDHMRGASANCADSDRSLFCVIFPRIGVYDQQPRNIFRIDEIEAVLPDSWPRPTPASSL
jgi:hypothetical protein